MALISPILDDRSFAAAQGRARPADPGLHARSGPTTTRPIRASRCWSCSRISASRCSTGSTRSPRRRRSNFSGCSASRRVPHARLRPSSPAPPSWRPASRSRSAPPSPPARFRSAPAARPTSGRSTASRSARSQHPACRNRRPATSSPSPGTAPRRHGVPTRWPARAWRRSRPPRSTSRPSWRADPNDPDAAPLDVSTTLDQLLWIAVLRKKTTDLALLRDQSLFVGLAFDEAVDRPFDLRRLGPDQTQAFRSDGLTSAPPPMVWRLWNGPGRDATTLAGGQRHHPRPGHHRSGRAPPAAPATRSRHAAAGHRGRGQPAPAGRREAGGSGGGLDQRRPAQGRPPQRRDPQGALGRAQRGPGRAVPGGRARAARHRDRRRRAAVPARAAEDAGAAPSDGTTVLPGTTVLQVEEPDGWHTWQEVDSFVVSRATDRHYTVDYTGGAVEFGDVRVPQLGERIRTLSYEYCAGAAGNVPAGAIKGLADVGGAKVANPLPAAGGMDAASLTDALDSIPAEIHRRDRAVIAADFGDLAREVTGVARAEPLPLLHPDTPAVQAAGVVSVVIFPDEDLTDPQAPLPGLGLLRRVAQYLDERRLVTTELYVIPPTYRAIAVAIGLAVRPGYQVDAVRRWVDQLLRQYLAPLPPFGPDGAGWPIGRTVRRAELEAVVVQVEGVEYATGLTLALDDDGTYTPRRRGGPGSLAGPPADRVHRGRGRPAEAGRAVRTRAPRIARALAAGRVLMTTSRGLSLLIQPDQWARCAHTGTALLPAGGVELTWDDSATAGPGRVCGPGCADRGSCEHRPGATAGSWPAPAGLAFDRWCRAYRSRPADGRVDVVDDLAPGPAATSATVPTSAGSRPCAGGLRRPVGVAVDRRDRLYIAETRCRRGARGRPVGRAGAAQGSLPGRPAGGRRGRLRSSGRAHRPAGAGPRGRPARAAARPRAGPAVLPDRAGRAPGCVRTAGAVAGAGRFRSGDAPRRHRARRAGRPDRPGRQPGRPARGRHATGAVRCAGSSWTATRRSSWSPSRPWGTTAARSPSRRTGGSRSRPRPATGGPPGPPRGSCPRAGC